VRLLFKQLKIHGAECFLKLSVGWAVSRISREPKFHYRVQKSQRLVPMLSQINPLNRIIYYLLSSFLVTSVKKLVTSASLLSSPIPSVRLSVYPSRTAEESFMKSATEEFHCRFKPDNTNGHFTC
jgi:hypothetical protein